tara:strand:- start:297 stop:545 length:249 start_codon:yes stop_codon:yes gene_type:complete
MNGVGQIVNIGISTLGVGVTELVVTFEKSYYYNKLPSIVLTATKIEGGGSTNVYVSDVTVTNFKINVSNAGASIDVHWHAMT